MRKRNLLSVALFATVGLLSGFRPAHADLVTYFNFNDSNPVSDVSVGGPTPNQTSTISTTPANSTYNFSGGGTTLNALGTDPAGLALTISTGATPSTSSFQFAVNLSTFADPTLTFARATTSAATNLQTTMEFSTNNGTTFTTFGTDSMPILTSGYQTTSFNLSSFNAVDNASNVIFRFSGFNTGLVTYRYDNIQLNAVATPEPSTYAVMALGLVAIAVLGARRKRSEPSA